MQILCVFRLGRFVVSPADGEEEQESFDSRNDDDSVASSQPGTPGPGSIVHTPSNPPTPSATLVPRIAETPPPLDTPGTPGSGGDRSPLGGGSNGNAHRDAHNTPRASIPGGERGKIQQ